MVTRVSKIIFLSAMALFCFLVVYSNITDYWVNYSMVQHVLMMKDIFPNATIGYRAINNPMLHHFAYIAIISCEATTGILCIAGAIKLFLVRKAEAMRFNKAKSLAIAGLIMGFLTWQVLFWSIGGEWFEMWMSQMTQSALSTAFHIYMTFLVGVVFLVIKDE